MVTKVETFDVFVTGSSQLCVLSTTFASPLRYPRHLPTPDELGDCRHHMVLCRYQSLAMNAICPTKYAPIIMRHETALS